MDPAEAAQILIEQHGPAAGKKIAEKRHDAAKTERTKVFYLAVWKTIADIETADSRPLLPECRQAVEDAPESNGENQDSQDVIESDPVYVAASSPLMDFLGRVGVVLFVLVGMLFVTD